MLNDSLDVFSRAIVVMAVNVFLAVGVSMCLLFVVCVDVVLLEV